MKWHIVNLPDYFTHLLKVNLTDHERTYRILRDLINQEEAFGLLIRKTCSTERIDSVLQSLGWFGFREKMAALFLTKLQYGSFDFSVDRILVDDMVSFEDCFKDFAASGYSRSFLFAFYLKVAFGEGTFQYYQNRMPELLEFSKSKIVKIDWVMVLLAHYDHYLGNKALNSILSDGIEFEDIFNFLAEDQKEQMLENLFAYGQSINDPGIFINDMV